MSNRSGRVRSIDPGSSGTHRLKRRRRKIPPTFLICTQRWETSPRGKGSRLYFNIRHHNGTEHLIQLSPARQPLDGTDNDAMTALEDV